MLTVIREFFLRRTYAKIKGSGITESLAKLEVLAKLTPNVKVSTYIKDRIIIKAHCDSIEELPVMLLSLKDDVEQQKSLYIPTRFQTLKEGSVSEWCINAEDEYVSLLEMAPKILNALKILKSELDKTNDSFYVDYVNRKSIYFTSDVDQFISVLKAVHY